MIIDSLNLRVTSESVEDTFALAETIASHVKSGDCLVLSGDLGAGKTHFAKGFAEALNIQEQIVSPTFSLANVYDSGRLEFIHFDLYRLSDVSELEDIDFYALTESEAVCLIEWGEKFIEEMPDDYLQINIEKNSETNRLFSFTAHGCRSHTLLQEIFTGK